MKYRLILASVVLIIAIASSSKATANFTLDTISIKSMPDDTSKCLKYAKISEELRVFNLERGLYFAELGLDLSRKLGYKYGIARNFKSLGVNYWGMGVYELALENFLNSLPLFEEVGDFDQVARIYNNIGLVYFARTLYDQSEEYFFKSLEMFKKNDDNLFQPWVLSNIGLIKFELKDFQAALDYHSRSYNAAIEHNDTVLNANNKCFIGRAYTHLNDFKLGKKNLFESLEMFLKLNSPNNVAMVYNLIADHFLLRKQYDSSIYYAKKGYSLGEEIGNMYMRMESAKYIYKSYEGLRNFEKALDFALHSFELLDTMKNVGNIKAIAHKEATFEYERKLKTIENEKEKEIYKNKIIARTAIFTAAMLFIIAIISFAFYRLKSKTNEILILKNEEISSLNKELEKTSAEKDIFMSIIAHDLKNPIGNFKLTTGLLADEYDNLSQDEHKELLDLLKESAIGINELLANLLEWTRSQRGKIDFTPVEVNISEITRLTISLLNNSAQNKSIAVSNLLDESLSVFADVNMLKTVLRNLISNAIKFTDIGGKIEIGVIDDYDKSLLSIYVKDNGVGMSREAIDMLFRIDKTTSSHGTVGEKGTGLGLLICKDFVERNGGKIWVESIQGEGSSFIFSVPKFVKNGDANDDK